MIRFLVRAVVFLVSAAVGLFVAAAVVDGVSVGASGLVAAVVVFAVLQSVLAPFFAKVAARNAPAFLGGIGLVSTFVALLAATTITDSLSITGGAVTWLAATVVVWLATALATLALPVLLAWVGLESRRSPA
ncbi:MAG TPA: hypothetical protein VLA55_05770 [Ornithinibacter sp.]|nr:hypothetical protein [Ornithinibacter sp.]